MTWYGNGPAPKNKFYGNLQEDDHNREYERLYKAEEERAKKKREAEIKHKWPNYADVLDEIAHMEDDMRHREIALDHLREERDILKQLLGIYNGET